MFLNANSFEVLILNCKDNSGKGNPDLVIHLPKDDSSSPAIAGVNGNFLPLKISDSQYFIKGDFKTDSGSIVGFIVFKIDRYSGNLTGVWKIGDTQMYYQNAPCTKRPNNKKF